MNGTRTLCVADLVRILETSCRFVHVCQPKAVLLACSPYPPNSVFFLCCLLFLARQSFKLEVQFLSTLFE